MNSPTIATNNTTIPPNLSSYKRTLQSYLRSEMFQADQVETWLYNTWFNPVTQGSLTIFYFDKGTQRTYFQDMFEHGCRAASTCGFVIPYYSLCKMIDQKSTHMTICSYVAHDVWLTIDTQVADKVVDVVQNQSIHMVLFAQSDIVLPQKILDLPSTVFLSLQSSKFSVDKGSESEYYKNICRQTFTLVEKTVEANRQVDTDTCDRQYEILPNELVLCILEFIESDKVTRWADLVCTKPYIYDHEVYLEHLRLQALPENERVSQLERRMIRMLYGKFSNDEQIYRIFGKHWSQVSQIIHHGSHQMKNLHNLVWFGADYVQIFINKYIFHRPSDNNNESQEQQYKKEISSIQWKRVKDAVKRGLVASKHDTAHNMRVLYYKNGVSIGYPKHAPTTSDDKMQE